MKKLSIIIPVYNEVHTIEKIIDKILAVDIPFEKEIVLVDDCSKDGTVEILKKIEKEHPEWIVKYHNENKGKGAALKTAFDVFTGDIAIIQDADLEYDPSEYSSLLKPIIDGHADVVYGSRFLGGGPHRVVYFWHYLGNKFISLLSNMMTNLNLTDIEVCYKVFKREVIKSITLKEPRFGIEPEITAKVAKGQWVVYEVPISYYGRSYSEGKKITWRDGVSALRCIIKYRFLD